MMFKTICTVTDNNLPIMTEILSNHNIMYTTVKFTNSENIIGHRINIDFNKQLYFKEYVYPEYQAMINTLSQFDYTERKRSARNY